MVAIDTSIRSPKAAQSLAVSRQSNETVELIRGSWSMDELRSRREEARRLQRLIFGQEVRMMPAR